MFLQKCLEGYKRKKESYYNEKRIRISHVARCKE